MPRNGRRARQRVQRVADEPRLTREPGKHGHLAIRSDASAGDPSDDGENARVGREFAQDSMHQTAEPAWGT